MHMMIAITPNGIDVIHTHFKLSAYAHLVPITAPWIMAGVTPGTVDI
jgi:hypothetical protein